MNKTVPSPLWPLSICIPTCNRPDLLARALASVVGAATPRVEIVVSDNSEDERSARVCERMLDLGSERHQYVRNSPGVGLAGNHNRCIELARGEWMLILHDDDYLLRGAVQTLASAAQAADGESAALLFGVSVVDAAGKVLKRQKFERERHMRPPDALRCLLSNSSFVRPPAIVVRRAAYRALGGFDEDMHGTIDIDMWSRLFSVYGVTCMPQTTAAYTVHAAAATTAVFEPGTVARINTIFDRVSKEGVISEAVTRRCQRDYLHQFILGGTYRRIREGDRDGARAVMQLFALPPVRRLGVSPRWALVRTAFLLLTAAPRAARA